MLDLAHAVAHDLGLATVERRAGVAFRWLVHLPGVDRHPHAGEIGVME